MRKQDPNTAKNHSQTPTAINLTSYKLCASCVWMALVLCLGCDQNTNYQNKDSGFDSTLEDTQTADADEPQDTETDIFIPSIPECTDESCYEPCLDDANCPETLVCRASLMDPQCVTIGNAPDGSRCSKDRLCAGVCSLDEVCVPSCTKNSDCQGSDLCVLSRSFALGCSPSSPCENCTSPGSYCGNSGCISKNCTQKSECLWGQECLINPDTPKLGMCVDGDRGCGIRDFMVGIYCASKQPCVSDDECEDDYLCISVEGFQDQENYPPQDNEIGFCAKERD